MNLYEIRKRGLGRLYKAKDVDLNRKESSYCIGIALYAGISILWICLFFYTYLVICGKL